MDAASYLYGSRDRCPIDLCVDPICYAEGEPEGGVREIVEPEQRRRRLCKSRLCEAMGEMDTKGILLITLRCGHVDQFIAVIGFRVILLRLGLSPGRILFRWRILD